MLAEKSSRVGGGELGSGEMAGRSCSALTHFARQSRSSVGGEGASLLCARPALQSVGEQSGETSAMPVGRAPEIPGLSQPHTYKSPSLHHISASDILKAREYACCMLGVSLAAVNMNIL